MTEVATCPSCGAPGLEPFHRVAGAPVHSVTLIPSRSAARALATGIISLGLCGRCGFISNMAFDAGLQDYSRDYESSQIHSDVFSAFHRELAGGLVSRHGLHGRSVIEIGCGQGEFLRLLCDLGAGRGVGFDPAYDGERQDLPESVTVVKDYFSERYADVEADFICCKMTLEHIPDTGGFLRIVRRALGDRRNATVFFQVPHAGRILDEVAFWDVYYEHCSYFHPDSLAALFRRAGFAVRDVWTGYDDQYLMIEAMPAPAGGDGAGSFEPAGIDADWRRRVDRFARLVPQVLDEWRAGLAQGHRRGLRTLLWGGGSKAVAFLTTLGAGDEIAAAVDINPLKRGTFLAGTGHPVIGPQDVAGLAPDRIVIMNPIYVSEVAAMLAGMGVTAELVPVTAGIGAGVRAAWPRTGS